MVCKKNFFFDKFVNIEKIAKKIELSVIRVRQWQQSD